MDTWGITPFRNGNWHHNMTIFSKHTSFFCLSVCLPACLTLAHSECTSVKWGGGVVAGVIHMQDVVGLNPKPGIQHTEWEICYFPQFLYVNSGTLPKIIPLPYPSTSCPIHHSVITASLDTVPPETMKAVKYNTNKTTQNNWIWEADGCKSNFLFADNT
jgi:hypothetical protein